MKLYWEIVAPSTTGDTIIHGGFTSKQQAEFFLKVYKEDFNVFNEGVPSTYLDTLEVRERKSEC